MMQLAVIIMLLRRPVNLDCPLTEEVVFDVKGCANFAEDSPVIQKTQFYSGLLRNSLN